MTSQPGQQTIVIHIFPNMTHSETWIWIVHPDPGPRPIKTWNMKILDSEKPGP